MIKEMANWVPDFLLTVVQSLLPHSMWLWLNLPNIKTTTDGQIGMKCNMSKIITKI